MPRDNVHRVVMGAGQLAPFLGERMLAEQRHYRSKKFDAPSWLWNSIVELIITHKRGYLEHCRRYPLGI